MSIKKTQRIGIFEFVVSYLKKCLSGLRCCHLRAVRCVSLSPWVYSSIRPLNTAPLADCLRSAIVHGSAFSASVESCGAGGTLLAEKTFFPRRGARSCSSGGRRVFTAVVLAFPFEVKSIACSQAVTLSRTARRNHAGTSPTFSSITVWYVSRFAASPGCADFRNSDPAKKDNTDASAARNP